MGVMTGISRRGLLAAQAGLAAMIALPGAARARARAPGADCLPAGDGAGPACAPARWPTATAEELSAHLGERFRVHSAAHGTMVLRLVAVEPARSGAARPRGLARREGVTAVFESPDMAPLVAEGAGLYRVSHPRIGAADLYLSALPRQGGGHHVELVLN